MKNASFLLGALSLVVALSFAELPAQDKTTPQRDLSDTVIEDIHVVVQLEYIQISFLVRDEDGNLIRDLSPDDFELFENGVPRQIATLREREVPISAVILLDTSWSVGKFLENAARTAAEFFQGLQDEKVAFVMFSEKPRLVVNWNERPEGVLNHFQDLETDGKTALYDSVIWTADNLFLDQSGKKLIILITDGIDTTSESNFEGMIAAARRAGITLYPVIYTNDAIQSYRKRIGNSIRPASFRISEDFHRFVVMQNQFIQQSLRYGGRTIFSNAFADLDRIYSDIIKEMKSHYVMLYESEPDFPSDNRNVKVQTKRGPGKIFIEITH